MVRLGKSRGAYTRGSREEEAKERFKGVRARYQSWGASLLTEKSFGRNKIQDAWEPTMFTVTEVPTEDGGPYTVIPYNGEGAPRSQSC